MRSRRVRILSLASVILAVTATTVRAQQNSTAPQQPTRTVPLFNFHSNFWVNLHQVLFHEALLSAGKPDRRLQNNTPLTASQMSGQEKADWNAAVGFYAKKFGTRQELFDDEMVRINAELAKQSDDGTELNAAGLSSELTTALRSAAPIYRKYWWPAHNQSNENWISSQRERVQDLGPKLAAAMTKDLKQQWPSAPIRVDVSYYVAEIGHAYTTDTPPHTTFSSSSPSLQGLNGFEVLFHEASHTFADTMSDALYGECRAQQKNCGDLWHAVLFYTSGVELRRLLPTAEQASFTPYAYEYGVYTRGNWPKYRRVLEADWQAYLDGKMTFAEAIHTMVAGLQ